LDVLKELLDQDSPRSTCCSILHLGSSQRIGSNVMLVSSLLFTIFMEKKAAVTSVIVFVSVAGAGSEFCFARFFLAIGLLWPRVISLSVHCSSLVRPLHLRTASALWLSFSSPFKISYGGCHLPFPF